MRHLIILGIFCLSTCLLQAQELTEFGIDVKKYVPRGLAIKSTAPATIGISGDGVKFESRYALRQGPLIISFIHGSWSEDSQARIDLITSHAADFSGAGAQVVIVSSDTPERVNILGDDVPSNIHLVADYENKTMKSFDVLYHVLSEWAAEEERRTGGEIGSSAKETLTLPVMATFVLSMDGTVYWSHFEYDSSIQPDIDELIQAIPQARK
jgi:peroxiredoxin